MDKPIMFMTVGLPGCGKSTWSKSTGLPVFSSDELRKEMPEADNGKIFTELHKRMKKALTEGKSIIFDATNLERKNRRQFLDEIKGIDCEKVCKFFLVPVDVCMERNSHREGVARVPEEVYDKMLKSFNVPSCHYDGFDTIEVELYNGDFKLPDYANLDAFSQDNPHHTESLGEHLKMAEAAAQRLTEGVDEELASICITAARWHDIGKVHTKDFHNSKGETSNEAHYYGHDNYGAYMYLLTWLKANPDLQNKDFAFKVAEVINWHMAPHVVWKQSAKRLHFDREHLDPDIVKAIDAVHKADLIATIDSMENTEEEDMEKDV